MPAEASVFERVLRDVLSGDQGLNTDRDLNPVFIGLSLLRQPVKFKVVMGIIKKKPLPEISKAYGVRYNYVQRVVNKLAKEGLVVKTRVLGKVVVLATPTLESAFKLVLKELYLRAKKGEDISKYGLSLDVLEKIFAKREEKVMHHE